uniref:Transmembrane protein n=1 Tax=Cacopsylla melanoneura TaxID=428564 RepID=A0A8D8RQG3_9HEMI
MHSHSKQKMYLFDLFPHQRPNFASHPYYGLQQLARFECSTKKKPQLPLQLSFYQFPKKSFFSTEVFSLCTHSSRVSLLQRFFCLFVKVTNFFFFFFKRRCEPTFGRKRECCTAKI